MRETNTLLVPPHSPTNPQETVAEDLAPSVGRTRSQDALTARTQPPTDAWQQNLGPTIPRTHVRELSNIQAYETSFHSAGRHQLSCLLVSKSSWARKPGDKKRTHRSLTHWTPEGHQTSSLGVEYPLEHDSRGTFVQAGLSMPPLNNDLGRQALPHPCNLSAK